MDTPWHRCDWQPLGHLRRQETAAAAPMACGSPIALAILGLVSTALERRLCRADHWEGIGTTGKRCQRASVRKEMSPTECAKEQLWAAQLLEYTESEPRRCSSFQRE